MDSSAPSILVLSAGGQHVADLERGLVAAGFEATTRATIDPATNPTLILVDRQAGAERDLLAAALERARGAARTSVIVIVGRDDDESASQALAEGADDVVRVPCNESELVARVKAQLRVHGILAEHERKEHDAQAMVELTQALASSLDFREILFTVVRRIAEVVRVGRVSIVLAPEDESAGYVVAASDDATVSNLRIDLSKYPEIQQVLRTGEPLVIRDASTHPILDGVREDVQATKLSPVALVPILWEEQAMGVLFLRAVADRGALSSPELRFCRVVANATAVALRNARVLKSLRDHTQQATFARFEAENRLRSVKRYADLFASAADGMAVVDPEGRLLFANPRAFEIVGVPEHDAVGHKILEFVHEVDRLRARDVWKGFRGGSLPRLVDLQAMRSDGQTVIVSCSFSALPSVDDAVLLTFRDVTEERRTAAELVRTKEFLESLIDASVDAIVAADLKGTIILFNKGAEQIYGYRSADVVGKMHVTALYPDGIAREVMAALKSPQHGGVGRLDGMQTEALDARAQRLPISLSAAFVYDDGIPVATFGIFKDLRDKIRVEERLAHAQQKLAVTEKQALIAEMAGAFAHELNQPLTSVTVYAEVLKRKLAAQSQEQQAAEMILHEAERMANIVKKIGKITKYETTTYVGRQKILDLDRATSEGTSPPKREP